MKKILEIFAQQKEYKDINRVLNSPREKQLPMLVTGLSDGAREAFYSCLVSDRRNKKSPMLALLPQEKDISKLETALTRYGLRVMTYPLRDFTIRNITASHEYEHERLSVLYSIINNECDIVLASPDAALQYTMPRSVLESRILTVHSLDTVDIEMLCRLLAECGYACVDMVEASGQYSRRGGIVDIFSPGMNEPVRIEFFGDEIDRMSLFDIMSQRRSTDVDKLDIIPVREVVLSRGQSEELESIIKKLITKSKDPHVREELKKELDAVENGCELKSIDKYISFVYPQKECLFDYFDAEDSIIYQEYNALVQRVKGYEFREKDGDTLAITSGIADGRYIEHTLGADAFDDIMRTRKNVIVNSFAVSMSGMELSGIYTFVSRQTPVLGDNYSLLLNESCRGSHKYH